MTELRWWGKAGQRLTDAEARAADTRNRQRLAERAFSEQRDRHDWAAGKVVPARITQALDMHALEGPGVDDACGVEEPAVDQWEAGTLYPNFEQLKKLSALCGVTPGFFMRSHDTIPVGETSMRFHKIGGRSTDWRSPPPIRSFTPEALATHRGRAVET